MKLINSLYKNFHKKNRRSHNKNWKKLKNYKKQ